MHLDPCDQGLPKPGEPETLIPKVTQQTLADMIGTTRSRVGFFMNRFRKLGFIECNGRIRIHKSLLNVILHNQSSEDHPVDAPLFGIQAGLAKPARNGTASVATIEENED